MSQLNESSRIKLANALTACGLHPARAQQLSQSAYICMEGSTGGEATDKHIQQLAWAIYEPIRKWGDGSPADPPKTATCEACGARGPVEDVAERLLCKVCEELERKM